MDNTSNSRSDFRDVHAHDTSLPFPASSLPFTSAAHSYSHQPPFSSPLPNYLPPNRPSTKPLPPHLSHAHLKPPNAPPPLNPPQSHFKGLLDPQSAPTHNPQNRNPQNHNPQNHNLHNPQYPSFSKPLPPPPLSPSFPAINNNQPHPFPYRPNPSSYPSSTTPPANAAKSAETPSQHLPPPSSSALPPASSSAHPPSLPQPPQQQQQLQQPPLPATASASASASAAASAAAPTNSHHHHFPPNPDSRPAPTTSSHQEQGPLYDIAKLLAARCTIVGGKVYNDKGHNICGVLNQHDKPCKRIGKCPFHGAHKPVTRHNSVNGNVDASGTVPTPSTSPDPTHSPAAHSSAIHANGSPVGSTSTTVNASKPKVPPKQQYKHGWSKEEHFLFLGGLDQHGRGSWKQIASVVKTRTPTQVQSHAQKFFQRQKQSDKNKRSIHDLSLNSPEMQEIAKKFKAHPKPISNSNNPNLNSNAPPITLANNLHISALGAPDPSSYRPTHPSHINPSALAIPQNTTNSIFAPDAMGRGVVNDAGLTRFGTAAVNNPINNSLMQKFAPGQATSATTLGSSLSSAVHLPQMSGAPASRLHYQPGPNPTHQHNDLFVPFNAGHVGASNPRRTDLNAAAVKMDPSASGRDVLLSSVKPAFMQEQYHVNAPNNNLMQPQFLAGKAAALNAAQSRTGLGASASLGGEAANVPLDQGSTHPSYGSSGLQAMYPTANANNAMYAHPRSSSDPQIQWGYSGGGGKRHSITQKDTGFPMNPQQLTTLQNIGQISMPDSLSGTPTVGNEHALDTTFDTAQQNQPNAFTGAMFGGSDGVEVGADASNVYGVGVVAPGGTSNINMRDVGHSIPGFTGSTGLQLSGSPMRGHGQYQANPYNRGGS